MPLIPFRCDDDLSGRIDIAAAGNRSQWLREAAEEKLTRGTETPVTIPPIDFDTPTGDPPAAVRNKIGQTSRRSEKRTESIGASSQTENGKRDELPEASIAAETSPAANIDPKESCSHSEIEHVVRSWGSIDKCRRCGKRLSDPKR